jgi:hypothetical protein
MCSNFKFFVGKITLKEYLHKLGYNNIWDLKQAADVCNHMEYYDRVVRTFNYKKEEDLEYQEYLRECQEIIDNHVNPIHSDDNDLPF